VNPLGTSLKVLLIMTFCYLCRLLDSTIYDLFSSSLAWFSKFRDNLEISVMDTIEDRGILSHVGHLRRTPELSQENGSWKVFFWSSNVTNVTPNITKCHTCGIFSEENGKWIMEYSFRTDPEHGPERDTLSSATSFSKFMTIVPLRKKREREKFIFKFLSIDRLSLQHLVYRCIVFHRSPCWKIRRKLKAWKIDDGVFPGSAKSAKVIVTWLYGMEFP